MYASEKKAQALRTVIFTVPICVMISLFCHVSRALTSREKLYNVRYAEEPQTGSRLRMHDGERMTSGTSKLWADLRGDVLD